MTDNNILPNRPIKNILNYDKGAGVSILVDLLNPLWSEVNQYFSIGFDALVDRTIFEKVYYVLDEKDTGNHLLMVDSLRDTALFKPNYLANPAQFYKQVVHIHAPIRLRLLLGNPGTGKTSFLRYFFELQLQNEQFENGKLIRHIRLDLNATNASHIEEYLYSELNSFIRQHATAIETLDPFDQIISLSKEFNMVVIFDNIDKIDSPERENQIIEYILHIYNSIKNRMQSYNLSQGYNLLIITAARTSTYVDLARRSLFLTRQADIEVDLLPYPPLTNIISKRLDLIEERISTTIDSKMRIRGVLDHNGMAIKYDISIAQQCAVLCYLVSNLSAETLEFLSYVTFGNVRSSILLTISYLQAEQFNHSSIAYALLQSVTHGNGLQNINLRSYQIQRHSFIKFLYQTPSLQYRFDLISHDNLFDCDTVVDENNWQIFLVKLRALQSIRYLCDYGIDDNQHNGSSLTVNKVVGLLNKLGYQDAYSCSALISLLKHRLIITSTLNPNIISRSCHDEVYVSQTGNYFLDQIIYDISYMEAIVPSLKLGLNICDINRPNVFNYTIEAVRAIGLAEIIETKTLLAKKQSESLIFLNNITRKQMLFNILIKSHLDALQKLEKSGGDTRVRIQLIRYRQLQDDLNGIVRASEQAP